MRRAARVVGPGPYQWRWVGDRIDHPRPAGSGGPRRGSVTRPRQASWLGDCRWPAETAGCAPRKPRRAGAGRPAPTLHLAMRAAPGLRARQSITAPTGASLHRFVSGDERWASPPGAQALRAAWTAVGQATAYGSPIMAMGEPGKAATANASLWVGDHRAGADVSLRRMVMRQRRLGRSPSSNSVQSSISNPEARRSTRTGSKKWTTKPPFS